MAISPPYSRPAAPPKRPAGQARLSSASLVGANAGIHADRRKARNQRSAAGVQSKPPRSDDWHAQAVLDSHGPRGWKADEATQKCDAASVRGRLPRHANAGGALSGSVRWLNRQCNPMPENLLARAIARTEVGSAANVLSAAPLRSAAIPPSIYRTKRYRRRHGSRTDAQTTPESAGTVKRLYSEREARQRRASDTPRLYPRASSQI